MGGGPDILRPGELEVSPDPLTLRAQVGATARGTIALTNIGDLPLSLESISFVEAAPAFLLEDQWIGYPLALPARQSVELTVRFAPEMEGPHLAQLAFAAAERPVLKTRIIANGDPKPCRDCCVPGETRACRPQGSLPSVGACTDGQEVCGDAHEWTRVCEGYVGPVSEICENGIDENCDGAADDGCYVPPTEPEPAAEIIDVPQPSSVSCNGENPTNRFMCTELASATIRPIQSMCRQKFPTDRRPPCKVRRQGESYYLDPARGDDGNSGRDPAKPWASLCHALATMPEGNTLNVAEGTYLIAGLVIDREISVVGGWDSSFDTWDPDLFHSVFTGKLTLAHGGSVWAGFYMQAADENWVDSIAHLEYHFVRAGTFVRNYVEVIWDPRAGSNHFYAVTAAPCSATGSSIACNDFYFSSAGVGASGIEYGNHELQEGQGWLVANRICMDSQSGWYRHAISGYGTCVPATRPSEIIIANNLVELSPRSRAGTGLDFYSCDFGLDLYVTVSNNTFIGVEDGVRGGNSYFDNIVHWKLTNNIFAASNLSDTASWLVGEPVQYDSSEHNLFFNFATNTMVPAPLMTAGDDLLNNATWMSVFAGTADFSLKLGGEGVGTGLNIYGDRDYGDVRYDLTGRERPMNGVWDRGAYQYAP